jgi:carbon storage regulator
MLVLSRKRSEWIVIGSSIRITVVKVDGNQVRLGIEAPGSLPIVRAELLPRRPRPRPRHPDVANPDPNAGAPERSPGG